MDNCEALIKNAKEVQQMLTVVENGVRKLVRMEEDITMQLIKENNFLREENKRLKLRIEDLSNVIRMQKRFL